MAKLENLLTVMYDAAAKSPTAPALRIPKLKEGSKEVESYDTVSFQQFADDVERGARFWAKRLSEQGLEERSVVGVWLAGVTYEDVVHMWALARACYVPMFLSLRLSTAQVGFGLLAKAGAQALVVAPEAASVLAGISPVAILPTAPWSELDADDAPLPPLWHPSDPEQDLVAIYHTSGSTSGSPKMVPFTAKWYDFQIQKIRLIHQLLPSDGQVSFSVGSVAHFGGVLSLVSDHDQGNCLVLLSAFPYAVDEVAAATTLCGVTVPHFYGLVLGAVIRRARVDPAMLAVMRSWTWATYTGTGVPSEDLLWAHEQGFRFLSFFGCTEVGSALYSEGQLEGDKEVMRLQPGTALEMAPVEDRSEQQLVELTVLPDSGDYPHESLVQDKGKPYRTGDLFLEVRPGEFLPMGREDDWIKLEPAYRCNTAAIESAVMEACGKDLVGACVVTGNGRRLPALFVEPLDVVAAEAIGELDRFKQDIFERLAHLREVGLKEERIESTDLILVKAAGTLPRTAQKGNIRRKLTEEMFKEELDAAYAKVAPQ